MAKQTLEKLIKKSNYVRLYEFSKDYLKRNPSAMTDRYFCLIPPQPEFNSGFQYAEKGYPAYIGIYTEDQRGYKIATERFPFFENICEHCGQVIRDDDEA